MSSKTLAKFLEENLEDLKSKGLYNVIDPLESSNGPIITIGGKEYINLSSNNYLGLATDSRLQEAELVLFISTVLEQGLFVQLTVL